MAASRGGRERGQVGAGRLDWADHRYSGQGPGCCNQTEAEASTGRPGQEPCTAVVFAERGDTGGTAVQKNRLEMPGTLHAQVRWMIGGGPSFSHFRIVYARIEDMTDLCRTPGFGSTERSLAGLRGEADVAARTPARTLHALLHALCTHSARTLHALWSPLVPSGPLWFSGSAETNARGGVMRRG